MALFGSSWLEDIPILVGLMFNPVNVFDSWFTGFGVSFLIIALIAVGWLVFSFIKERIL